MGVLISLPMRFSCFDFVSIYSASAIITRSGRHKAEPSCMAISNNWIGEDGLRLVEWLGIGSISQQV